MKWWVSRVEKQYQEIEKERDYIRNLSNHLFIKSFNPHTLGTYYLPGTELGSVDAEIWSHPFSWGAQILLRPWRNKWTMTIQCGIKIELGMQTEGVQEGPPDTESYVYACMCACVCEGFLEENWTPWIKYLSIKVSSSYKRECWKAIQAKEIVS